MKYHHTSIPEKFDTLIAQSQSFRAAVEHAQRVANNTGKQMRIFKSYGLFCARGSSDAYYGTHETFINRG